LTDSQGRTVDFRHTVVLMTSNLASRAILESAKRHAEMGEGDPMALAAADADLDRAVEEALSRQFRPEFLNRIDEVIRFRPLGRADLQRIVRLQIKELEALLAEQQLQLQVEEPVVALLAQQGYEPEYGARPLRRVLRRRIVCRGRPSPRRASLHPWLRHVPSGSDHPNHHQPEHTRATGGAWPHPSAWRIRRCRYG
jgi:ATP-dependent Clp protease ATP-binding subunit ClpA